MLRGQSPYVNNDQLWFPFLVKSFRINLNISLVAKAKYLIQNTFPEKKRSINF